MSTELLVPIGTVTRLAMVCPGPSTLIDDANGRGTPVGYTVTKPASAEPSAVRFSTTALEPGGTPVRAKVNASPTFVRWAKPRAIRVSRIRYGLTGTYADAPAGAACTIEAGATTHRLKHSIAATVETRARRR